MDMYRYMLIGVISLIGIILIVILGFGFIFLRGNEDAWICENNQWIKHGEPGELMPETGCGDVTRTAILQKSNLIKVKDPQFSQEIVSPVTISGEARGSWFFEATFPIFIVDESGNVISQGLAKTEQNWMTEDFVPFTATLNFKKPEEKFGSIVLKKDNPSGLPDKDDSLEIPIIFK